MWHGLMRFACILHRERKDEMLWHAYLQSGCWCHWQDCNDGAHEMKGSSNGCHLMGDKEMMLEG